MSDKELREFYELCQTYRHTPLNEFTAVASAYDALVKFVELREQKEKSNDRPEASRS